MFLTVTQNTTAPTPSASNSTTLTCLTTTGTVIGTGGGTYIWSGPGITAGAATATFDYTWSDPDYYEQQINRMIPGYDYSSGRR